MRSPSVIDQLFEQLTTLSNQLKSVVELSSSLQAQHATAQSTISALESKVIALEGLVKSSPLPIELTCPTLAEPAASLPPSPSLQPNSLTQMLNEWKQTVKGQWSSVHKEWETKVKAVETSLGTAASKFNAGLASLAVLQRQQQGLALGLGNCEIVKGFHRSRRGGLVTPLSPRSLSADSNRPRQRRKKVNWESG